MMTRMGTLALAGLRVASAKPNEQIRKKDERLLFLAVGFKKPHLPFVAPKTSWDLYDPAEIAVPSHDRPLKALDLAFTNWGELRGYSGIPKEGYCSDEQTRTVLHGYRDH